jgi:hypothetical protein
MGTSRIDWQNTYRRITVQVLAINDPDFVAVREAIIGERTASL